MTTTEITIKGAREHNLRGVNLKLPRGKMICFTGVSGSGKSSLAFDTLYAEGQRRYVESLSNYARQFMGQMPKPDVDLISGLSPAISISQKSTGNNPRSTVGTITEIYDFLRVLYARVGTGHCPECGTEITAQTREQILARILALEATSTLSILAPLVRTQKGEFKDLFEDLRKQGYARARVDGEVFRLSEPPQLDRQRRHDVDVVIDRLTPDSRTRGRLAEAVDAALKLGDGSVLVHIGEAGVSDADAVGGHDLLLSSRYACSDCGRSFPPPSPQLFSFNSPQGMCTGCDGLGRLYTFVPELLIPDPSLSFKRGAITLVGEWSSLGRYKRHVYKSVAETLERHWELEPGMMLSTPWQDLPERVRTAWLWGTGDLHITFTWRGGAKPTKYGGSFEGVIPELLDRYRTTKNKMHLRSLEKYMDTLRCPDCDGARLNPQARAVTLHSKHPSFGDHPDLSLPAICELSADRLAEFFAEVELGETAAMIAGEALKEIRTRIGFLLGVGLDYLSLARTAPTLSGGESQRIRLAGQIGSGLSGVLYILDEPSIGLHPRDNDRLIDTLLALRDRGNTLVVVEHDEDTIRAADMVVDFGPGPGVRGGKIVASGSVDAIAAAKQSVTGHFLSGSEKIEVPAKTRPIDGPRLTIRGAAHNNLRGIDVSVPLGTLVCVTGVSGSGKSSLIGDVLEPALRNALNGAELEPGEHAGIDGLEHLDKTIAIDQSPIGRTPRSNPGTYVKVFDEIRNLFARLPEAKTRGFKSSRFSFNVDGGRCSACDGNGATKLEMDFLADLWITCPVCEGHRYNRETLAVKFKGHSIADVLELDVAQALKLFKNIPKVAGVLQTLVDVGLEYLKLGQPSPTLSGGEAQRIKLSRELAKKSTGRTFYVLDEPTTGLHFADIKLLLGVLHGLVELGNTVLVVEHNLDVIKTADYVIDLGPEGGAGGGTVVVAGTPREVAACEASYTGRALKRLFDGESSRPGLTRSSAKGPTAKGMAAKGKGAIAGELLDAELDPGRLVVEGASQHNLKSVDVSIPRDAMTVFCGPSGSGKSSLAMDTIYAEGQRRYVESLSSYARQFIGQMQKPKAERIEGLSPAVALEQKNLGHSPRSTVGTVTEIYDYLRILMARLGTMYCPDCQLPVGTQTADQIVDKVLTLPEGTRFLLLAPLRRDPGQDPQELWQTLRSNGFARVRVDGKTYPLDAAPELDPRRQHQLQLVVDRLTLRADDQTRITQSVELALGIGSGVIQIAVASAERDEPLWETITHSQHLACESCGRSFSPLTPHHFSFNTAVGWCPQCEGLGRQTGTNPAALLRDPRMTLADGALLLWPSLDASVSRWMLGALSRQTGIPLDVPVDELSVLHRRKLYHGTGDLWIEVRPSDVDASTAKSADEARHSAVLFRYQFKGLYPALDEAARLSPGLRTKLEKFTDEIDCSACDGTRLRDVAAAVRFDGLTIGDLVRMPLDRLDEVARRWKLDARERRIAGELIREVRQRVRFLLDVGLDYLTLGRPAASLSGGEAQRIRLAAQLGSGLCGVLYVLDEPTIGLHPRDNERLVGALHRLRDLGNTLLVVEHDFDVIAGSDYLCDFGPKAGRHGGEIVAAGAPSEIDPEGPSATTAYITGHRSIPVPSNRRTSGGAKPQAVLKILAASEHNLRSIDVTLPLGLFVAVTGPSGSGKSTLINDILYPALARRLHRASLRPGRHGSIEGMASIDKVIRVDQSPLGNTPSSNPATYTGAFDLIRQLFAKLPEARAAGYTARQFSFNVPGGRCEACEGTGQRKIEMHFLPDVWVQCEDCQGHRYTPETLAVRYHGYSISEILDLPCGDALRVFQSQPKIARILQTICDVGLDYVTLGQSAPTLSGGEAQRVKLAAELARPDTGRTLYLLDEPTTGLHFDDIVKLLGVLQRLVDLGNSVVVIEHNLDVIKCADWIIDMGPEAGAGGGSVVCEGTPEEVVAYAASAKKGGRRGKSAAPRLRSYTGEYLAEMLEKSPHEVRTPFDPEQYAREQLELQKAHAQAEAATETLWELDGRSWHLDDPKDRTGAPVRWDKELLRKLIERIEATGRFAPTHFNHRSIIEVAGLADHPEAATPIRRGQDAPFHRKHWFLHAFSSESLWLKLKFRVPRGTFRKQELLDAFDLPTLSQMNLPEIYSSEARARVRSTQKYQEIELRLFKLEELELPEFDDFLAAAIESYCGGPPPTPPARGGGSLAQAVAVDGNGKSSTAIHGSRGSAVAGATQPWRVLGRRWHTLRKGFPTGQPPEWPLELADKTLDLFEKLAGGESLRYESAEHVTIQPPQARVAWAAVETKQPGALRVTIAGPSEAIDLEALEKIGTRGTVEVGDEGFSNVTFHFNEPAQIRNRMLHQFLKTHLSKTLDA
ncbi:excinuclease ABC subunit UvrA [Candidatus Laterigemmans baculatus]|nr:excinuclease ABC subunit UvrA [Candidatus Laterigemmans baculatus]